MTVKPLKAGTTIGAGKFHLTYLQRHSGLAHKTWHITEPTPPITFKSADQSKKLGQPSFALTFQL